MSKAYHCDHCGKRLDQPVERIAPWDLHSCGDRKCEEEAQEESRWLHKEWRYEQMVDSGE